MHEEDPLALLVEEKDEDDDEDVADKEANGTAVAETNLNGSGGKSIKGQESGDVANAEETARAANWDPVTGKIVLPDHFKRVLSAMKVTKHHEVRAAHILFIQEAGLFLDFFLYCSIRTGIEFVSTFFSCFAVYIFPPLSSPFLFLLFRLSCHLRLSSSLSS